MLQSRPTRCWAHFFFAVLFLSLFVWGCATTVDEGRQWVHPVYREKIKEWQMRIQEEGWSEKQVHSVLLQFRGLAAYRVEINDHWDTPADFIRQNFSGDCKNIAVFEMGVLKQLGYPYGVKILIVHALFEDHALLRVEMPEGGWKAYDVVAENVPSPRPDLLKPVAEFDEKRIGWFPQQSAKPHDARKPESIGAAPGDPTR